MLPAVRALSLPCFLFYCIEHRQWSELLEIVEQAFRDNGIGVTSFKRDKVMPCAPLLPSCARDRPPRHPPCSTRLVESSRHHTECLDQLLGKYGVASAIFRISPSGFFMVSDGFEIALQGHLLTVFTPSFLTRHQASGGSCTRHTGK